jgi:hypothetical protein
MADIKKQIRQWAEANGVDPAHALAMASIESTFNPTAVSPTGRHRGLFQFGDNEWSTYGSGDWRDVNEQLNAFGNYSGVIRNRMKELLGRDPTNQELYLGWQQGADGASKLIQAGDKPAWQIVGRNAVTGNLPKNMDPSNMTAAQFADFWSRKYNAHRGAVLGEPVVDDGSPKYIAAAPGVAEAPDGLLADARTAGDADLAGYGASPPLQQKEEKGIDYEKLLTAGKSLGSMFGTLEPAKPTPMPAMGQPHRGKAVDLIAMFKNPIGLLG